MRTIKFLLAILFSIAVAACGGGGGGSSSTPFSATTTGVAAKGIIKSATVTAYELNATGATLRTVGTSETDASGKYSLIVGSSYTGGPLKLVLSAKSDGSTKMVCDVSAGCGTSQVVAFGSDYALPLTFTLVAYQQAVSSGASVKTQITPFTNMAAARIEAQLQAVSPLPLDNSLVANANSEVNQIVGVDIANTEPVDISNPAAVAAAGADALQYAAFNAGIGSIAFADADGFEAGIAAVATSFADGQFDDSTDPVTIDDIVNAVSTEASATPALNTTTLAATLTSITTNTNNGIYDPEPAPAATLTAVAQARGLVSQTRTWGTQIAALQTPADAFGLDIDTANAVLNSTNGALAGVFGETLKGALIAVSNSSTNGLVANQPYTYPISAAGGTINGTGSVTVVTTGSFFTINFASTMAGVTSSGAITTNLPNNSSPSTILNLAALNLSITGSVSMTSPAVSLSLTNNSISIVLKTGKTLDTFTSEADFASLGFDGGLVMKANGVTFTGTGKFNMVTNDVVGAASTLSLAEISVSGTFSSVSKGSVDASASVKFNNAAHFDTIGLLSYQPLVWVNQSLPGDALGIAAAYNAQYPGDTLQWGEYNEFTNSICGYGLVNTNYSCVIGDPGIVALILAAYPTASKAENVYATYDMYSGSNYSALLTYPDFETAGNCAITSNCADATVTVSSHVTLTGYPKATLTVTAHRTAYDIAAPVQGTVVAILDFNHQSVKIEAANTAAPATGIVTITNPDGVELVVNGTEGSTTGTVRVDGTAVGTIDSIGGMPMIHYNDGTFESLN